MSYEKKVKVINMMEEIYNIRFTDEQIDVLLGDLSVEIERQKGKTFVIARKAILESIVATKPIKIKIYVKTKNDLKNMRDYIRVLANKMNIEYTCNKEDSITILNGSITIIIIQGNRLFGSFTCDYLLIDDITNTRFLVDRTENINTIKIEVINKDGIK